MAVGQVFPSEMTEFVDDVTGVKVKRLTRYKGNSYHIYFTNNGWYDKGTKLVFCSDRENRTNLFSLDLKTYEITQLTDLPQPPLPYEHKLATTFVDPVRDLAYFCCGRDLMKLDLHTYALTKLYTMPEKYVMSMVSCSHDSDYVYTSIFEDLSDKFHVDLHRGYIGFREICAYGPDSKIVKINIDGSGFRYIWEEKSWIGHVNASPTNQNHITFCHEGPWDVVDNRIWGMDTVSGKVWKIRPCVGKESVGHEYWYQDGVHIGYHGQKLDGSNQKLMGVVRFDGSDNQEVSFNYLTGHIFSLDRSLIVGDGSRDGKYVRLWKYDGEKYLKPRALCQHFSSFQTQEDHVHPRISTDGKAVLYTSDREGYGNVYLVQIPEYESLPLVDDVMSV